MPNKPPTRGRLFSRRNLLGLFVGTLGLALLVIACMPLWLGWAIRVFAPSDLVRFEDYRMQGYGHFQLTNVSIKHPQATVSIDRLKSLSPLNWYLKSGSDSDEDFITIERLTVTLPATPPEQENTEGSSLPKDLREALELLESALVKTDTWLPRASIKQATIIQGERQLELAGLKWRHRSLELSGTLSDFPDYSFRSQLNLKEDERTLEFAIPEGAFEFKTSLRSQGSDLVATGMLLFRDNTAFIETTFGQGTWAPESATWNLENWQLDLNSLGVNSVYSDLDFSLLGGWKDHQFENELKGQLSLADSIENIPLPEVQFDSAIGGNLDSLVVSRFSLDAPGVSARMNEEVEYQLKEMQLAGELNFAIDLDLGLLNHEDLQGRLTGFLNVTNNEGKPSGAFNLTGEAVKVMEHDFEQLDIQATLNWPVLKIDNTTARLTTGSTVNVFGSMDLETQSVKESKLTGTLQRATIADLLPENLSLESMNFEAEVSGPFRTIQHRGALTVDKLETETLLPVVANLTWEGLASQIDDLSLTAASETAELQLNASGDVLRQPMQWQINRLELQADGTALASLQAPTNLTLSRGELLAIQFDPFELSGPGGRIQSSGQISYPEAVTVSVLVETLKTDDWTKPWLKTALPPIEIGFLSTEASWNRGPLSFTTEFQATALEQDRPIRASGALSSDGKAMQFEKVEISDHQGPWVTVSGQAPASLHPGANKLIQLNKAADLDLSFTTSESQNWLNWLSSITPFSLERFNSQVILGGSLSNLKGNFEIDLQTEASAEEHGMPSTSVVTRGDIEGTLLSIENLNVQVAEEQFNAMGSVQLPAQLIEMVEDPSIEVPWEQTHFELRIPPSKLTPMRYFAPQLLSTGGEIQANLKGSIEGMMEGFFRIAGVNTRAIFPFGSLRDITADLDFNQSRATLNNISANIGREPVTISGSVDYSRWTKPHYQFSIAGKNLPLVRKPGLLLRSDLNLKIDNVEKDETAITGTVLMKDGLFLLNRTNLMAGGAGGGKTAETRPPFFSIDVPPLDNWDLNIEVKGDRFIRVKTPAADGALSIDMKLLGKLREPFATGRVEFDEGNLFFPFSSFRIDYGAVELPVGDPYAPLIEILGTSRRFGYDITVEITGSAYDPQVHFTSSPPLSSEQIMLMVMAGENPEGMFDYSGTQRASKLGTYISKGLFGNSNSDSNFFNRISFDSGENLSEQGKETMEIEYLLDERFQLVGEYDEYDFWNAGLRWRIFQRKVIEEEHDSQ